MHFCAQFSIHVITLVFSCAAIAPANKHAFIRPITLQSELRRCHAALESMHFAQTAHADEIERIHDFHEQRLGQATTAAAAAQSAAVEQVL